MDANCFKLTGAFVPNLNPSACQMLKNKICHYIAINSSKYHVQHGHTINDECEERKKVEKQQKKKTTSNTHGSKLKTIKLKPTNQPRNLFSRERENIFYFVVGNILFFLFFYFTFRLVSNTQRHDESTYMTI